METTAIKLYSLDAKSAKTYLVAVLFVDGGIGNKLHIIRKFNVTRFAYENPFFDSGFVHIPSDLP